MLNSSLNVNFNIFDYLIVIFWQNNILSLQTEWGNNNN